MKPEMKKLIIANLPYLLFVYLFDKLGQTYRLVAGADLSEKLLHLADGFSLAFESAAPSFHLFDLAVGVAGAVALRLMVYCKTDADDTAPEPGRELPEITEGQTFDKVTAAVTEHFTAPPKYYTEDTLLSAMERAGADDLPEDAER